MYVWYFHISRVHLLWFCAFHYMSTVWLFACFLLITKVPLFFSHRSLQKSAEQVHPSLWGPVLRHRACAQQAPEGQEGALTWRQVPSFRLSCPWKVWQFFQILIFFDALFSHLFLIWLHCLWLKRQLQQRFAVWLKAIYIEHLSYFNEFMHLMRGVTLGIGEDGSQILAFFLFSTC